MSISASRPDMRTSAGDESNSIIAVLGVLPKLNVSVIEDVLVGVHVVERLRGQTPMPTSSPASNSGSVFRKKSAFATCTVLQGLRRLLNDAPHSADSLPCTETSAICLMGTFCWQDTL